MARAKKSEIQPRKLTSQESLVRAEFCAAWNELQILKEKKAVDFSTKSFPSWDGGTSSMGRRYSSAWPGLTKFIRENALDPKNYFRWVCRNSNKTWNPTPNQAMSHAILMEYESSRTKSQTGENDPAVKKIRHEFNFFMDNLELRAAVVQNEYKYFDPPISADTVIKLTLTRGEWMTNAVVNFVIASCFPNREAMRLLYEAAYAIYQLKKGLYDIALGKFIEGKLRYYLENYSPEDFK